MKHRVIAGIDATPASLRALREAATEARRRHAELHVVHVRPRERPIPLPLLSECGSVIPPREPEPTDWLDRAATELILACLRDALGGAPGDLDVHVTVLIGRPHQELVSVGCRDSDLLVVGADGRRWWQLWRRSVSRYCAGHARCPVLVVPRDDFTRTMHRRIRTGHRVLPRDPWREFDATGGRESHPIY